MHIRRSLAAKFLLVLIPVFLTLSAVGLAIIGRQDTRAKLDELAARVGNQTARAAAALARHDANANPTLAQDLLAPLANDAAVLCVELRRHGDGGLIASLPPALGCAGQPKGELIESDVVDENDHVAAVLRVNFSLAEIARAETQQLTLMLAVLGGAFLLAVCSAAIGFRVIVGRPLRRLHAAIRRATETGAREAVEGASADELGQIITAFNAMIRRDAEREEALRQANEALQISRDALRRASDEAEAARVRAEDATEAKSRFLASMSHEIRTPLHGVLGMAELVLSTALDANQRRYTETLHRSGTGLLALINDILDFSKIEAGKLSLESIGFDLRELLADVEDAFRLRAAEKNLDFSVRIAEAVAPVRQGDPLRLKQIITNLVGNAIKFTHNGSVQVSVANAQADAGRDAIVIIVADTGIGISAAAARSLFASFAQADTSTTRRFGGTGLGLAISKQLTELMGGSVRLESAEGKGSTFFVTVPLARGAGVAATAAPNGAARAAGRSGGLRGRVLLAEDNAVNELIAVSILNGMGFDVSVAASGLEAVKLHRDGKFDLILMDCHMPDLDGVQATLRIRQAESRRQRTPIVAVTASALREDRERCLAAGMDDYLPKPFTREALEAVVAKLVAPESALTARPHLEGEPQRCEVEPSPLAQTAP